MEWNTYGETIVDIHVRKVVLLRWSIALTKGCFIETYILKPYVLHQHFLPSNVWNWNPCCFYVVHAMYMYFLHNRVITEHHFLVVVEIGWFYLSWALGIKKRVEMWHGCGRQRLLHLSSRCKPFAETMASLFSDGNITLTNEWVWPAVVWPCVHSRCKWADSD